MKPLKTLLRFIFTAIMAALIIYWGISFFIALLMMDTWFIYEPLDYNAGKMVLAFLGSVTGIICGAAEIIED